MYHIPLKVEHLVLVAALAVAAVLLLPARPFANGFYDVRPVYAYADKNTAVVLLWNATDTNVEINATLGNVACTPTTLPPYSLTSITCPVDPQPPGTTQEKTLCVGETCSPVSLTFI